MKTLHRGPLEEWRHLRTEHLFAYPVTPVASESGVVYLEDLPLGDSGKNKCVSNEYR